MENNKILEKLKSKAKVYKNTEVIEEDMVETEDLEDFYKIDGQLFFIEAGEYFLKDSRHGWIKFKPKEEEKMYDSQVTDLNVEQRLKLIEEQVRNLNAWTIKFKEYIENHLDQLYKSMNVALSALDVASKEQH